MFGVENKIIINVVAFIVGMGGVLCLKACFKQNPELGLKQALSQSNRIIIDVRTAREFEGGHISGAINVPHTEIDAKISHVVGTKQTPIIAYCRSGARSAVAKKKLESLGYQTVVNAGGFQSLQSVIESLETAEDVSQ